LRDLHRRRDGLQRTRRGIGDATRGHPGSPPRSDYETEFDFIECIADHITARDPSIEIIDELEFINSMYPWFEPRTAPLRPADIERLLQQDRSRNSSRP
jgi:hypothetical protein